MARMGQPDFQGYAGPGDRDLPRSEIEGYQPPSRQGEVVMNAFGARPAFFSIYNPLFTALHTFTLTHTRFLFSQLTLTSSPR